MGKKKKAAIQLLILVSISCLIVWHAVSWHSTGMYLEMFNWVQTGRGYLTVLYNLGLMLTTGLILGFLMDRIFYLVGNKKKTENTQSSACLH